MCIEGGDFGFDLLFGAEDVAIILGEAAHAHDAMQGARGFVAVAGTKFTQAQRQFAIGTQAAVVDLHMSGAIHRFDRVIAVLRFGDEHVFLVVIPVAGFLPQGTVEDLRAAHFLVAAVAIYAPHVLLNFLPDDPAVRMPEHQAGRLVLQVEQVHLLAEFAVIAFLGLFQHVQIGVEIFLPGPGRTIDTLQLFIAMVAAPVGARHLHQLEDLELAGRGYVGAAAQIDEIGFAIQRDLFAGRNGFDQFGLVVLAHALEKFHGLVAWLDFPRHGYVALGELGHAVFDQREIFRSKRATVGKVVIKAVFHRRADGDLGIREQFLDGMGKQVGGRVADDVQTFGVLGGDDGQRAIAIDHMTGIHQALTNTSCQGCLGQSSTNGGSHLRHG